MTVAKKYESHQPWGFQLSIDLYDCNPGIIQDKESIKLYVEQLCVLIDMRRFGLCRVVYFGEDERIAGYSMTQFIETSLISGHFANQTNAAYIDIFSCKHYNEVVASEFTKAYFEAKRMKTNFLVRE